MSPIWVDDSLSRATMSFADPASDAAADATPTAVCALCEISTIDDAISLVPVETVETLAEIWLAAAATVAARSEVSSAVEAI